MKRIALMEDDEPLAHILGRYLGNSGFEVSLMHRGDTGLEALRVDPPDLLLLDIMLPGVDGFEVLRELRKKSNLLVMMVSAKRAEIDRVLGLEMGADDYLTKPVSARELLARVKALFRRSERESQDPPKGLRRTLIEVGRFGLDTTGRALIHEGKNVTLTSSEFGLAQRMMSQPGQVFSRENLAQAFEGDETHLSRAVDVHIANLRKKLSQLGVSPDPIRSIRGVGYKMES